MESISDILAFADILENSVVCQKFCWLKHQIFQFKSFSAQFRQKIGEMVRATHGNSMEEEKLLKIIEKSPFDPRKLVTWLYQKKQEFDFLHGYLKALEEFPFALQPKELEKFTKNVNVKYVLCITLSNITGSEIDSYLASMKKLFMDNESKDEADAVEDIEESWCKKECVTMALQSQIVLFRDFASTNKDKSDLRFVVVAASSKKARAEAPGSMILYTGGRRQLFQPPSAPGQPQMVSNAETEITISWSAPASGSKTVLSYNILYQLVGGASDGWEQLQTRGSELRATITNLSPGAKYYFKIEAAAKPGKSQSSPQSQPIKTKSIVPGLDEHQLATPDENSSSIEPEKKLSLAEIILPQCQEVKKGENGDPSWYQLPFHSSRIIDQKMLLREIEIGEPHKDILTTKVKVVLFIRATGTGKSTLFNGVVNFLYGVKWEEKFRLQLIPKESRESLARNQTTFVTKYVFHQQPSSRVDYTLIIIDSPGYGDTRGPDQDNVLTSQFTKFFKTAIEHLDIVGFIVKASDQRLTATQLYIFDSLQTLFGRDIKENIHLMFTFADGGKPLSLASINAANLPYEGYFKFDNSPFVAETDDNSPMNKMFWDLAYAGYQYFFDKLAATKSSSLALTRDVMENRHRVQETVEILSQRIKNGLKKFAVDEMKKHSLFIMECEEKQRYNKDYARTILVPCQRKVPFDDKNRYATNCQNCNETCHIDCSKGCNERCSVMDQNGRCLKCKGHCDWKMHYHRNYFWEEFTESKTITNDVMKQLYDQACANLLKTYRMLLRLAHEYIKFQESVQDAVQQLHPYLNRLVAIALRPPPDNPIKYIDHLLVQAQRENCDRSQSDYIRQLVKAREHAVWIKQMKDEGKSFDPFANMRKDLEKMASVFNMETMDAATVRNVVAALYKLLAFFQ